MHSCANVRSRDGELDRDVKETLSLSKIDSVSHVESGVEFGCKSNRVLKLNQHRNAALGIIPATVTALCAVL